MYKREVKVGDQMIVSLHSSVLPAAARSAMDHVSSSLQHRNYSSSRSDSGMEEEAIFTFFKVPARLGLSRYPGLLLSCHEHNAMFPAIHIADASYNRPQCFKPLAQNQDVQQGVYREIRRIDPEYDVMPYKNFITYILLGFNGFASNMNKVMIDTWKDWSGARHIYMNLPDELGLARITLFQREVPNSLSQFMYIVLVECRNVVTEEQQRMLMDFCQRLRVERITGYISVYSCESPMERDCLLHNR